MPGAVARIYLRPSARTPVREVTQVCALTGRGLEGDHAGGGARQVTILSEEAWEAARQDLGGLEIDPGGRRANVVVRGVVLKESIRGGLRIGDCLIRVAGETRPCRLMDDCTPGLQKALDPDCRGGVYGRILVGGEITVGDQVQVLRASDLPQEPEQLRFSATQGGDA